MACSFFPLLYVQNLPTISLITVDHKGAFGIVVQGAYLPDCRTESACKAQRSFDGVVQVLRHPDHLSPGPIGPLFERLTQGTAYWRIPCLLWCNSCDGFRFWFRFRRNLAGRSDALGYGRRCRGFRRSRADRSRLLQCRGGAFLGRGG